MKVQLYQKYSFKNHSYKCGNRELLVPRFCCYTKAQSQCVSKLLHDPGQSEQFPPTSLDIQRMKYRLAHSDGIFYTSCVRK